MAASTSASSTSNAAADSTHHLIKRIRSHEIAIVELNNLSSSRHYRGWRVYNRITWQYLGVTTRVTSFLRRRNENHEVVSRRWLNPRGPNGFGMLNQLGCLSENGNIFFRTTAQKATAFKQRQLDATKAKLQRLNSP